jgi:hypothetical protein
MTGWRDEPCWYASIVDGPTIYLLAGPFKSRGEAGILVERASWLASELMPYAHFFTPGAVQWPDGQRDGALNGKLGVAP